MVTPAQPQEVDQTIEFVESPDTDVDTDVSSVVEETNTTDTTEATDTEVTSTPVDTPPAEPVATATEEPPTPAAPQVDQAALDELKQRREAEQNQKWRDQLGQQARTYQQQLTEAGYLPEQAREQARRYIQTEQRVRQQEQESAQMLGFVEGRQAAATHFMKKHGLATQQMLDDLLALQRANTPAEMEQEAKRIKEHRDLRSENTRLKQGQVPPQTFDNSQGAAEATSNDQRLLDAYNNGDRSEAAVKAARRFAFGS